jgi:hypothetical protein
LPFTFYSGRKEIPVDNLPRRGFRSVSHCYSGCGGGEITGVFIVAGLLALNNWWVAGITFALAYFAGYSMTAGPLLQQGVGVRQALWDAFSSETATITVMEVVAIGVYLWLAGNVNYGQPSILVFTDFLLNNGTDCCLPSEHIAGVLWR